MRRAVLPLVLLLALAACSDDADDGGGDGGRDPDPSTAELASACDALGDDEASALVGIPVTRDDAPLRGGASCTYYDADDMGTLTVVVVAEDGSFDSLGDLAGSEAETETAPVDVPGAEEAIVVDDRTANLAITSLIARGDGLAFTVYPSGLTREDELRIGTAALTVLLGGEPAPAAAVDRTDVPHPCDQVSQAEAERALGVAVTATRFDDPDDLYVECVFETEVLRVSVFEADPIQRVDQLGSEINEEPPEEVPAPEPLTAFVPSGASQTGITLAVATDRTVLGIRVEGGPDAAESRRLAEALLPALVP